eukprot:scaffold5529_cov117-Cylindrotheca_fusiformis.AAC.28
MAEPLQRCMAGLPPTKELIGLKVPYGAWEPDTLITDTFGNPMFSVLDVQHHAMGSYEAIFGDENGHKLCYVKRRLITKYWKDGWDFCTYRPNFPGQPKYKERDMYGSKCRLLFLLTPPFLADFFTATLVRPTKCRYEYSIHEEDLENMECHLEAMHGWLGSMTICCTPMVRFGKWQMEFHRPGAGDPELNLDQSKNLLEVERGNDLLAALCIAYAFDKALCQPLVTIIGYQEKEHMDDDDSLEDEDYYDPEYPALPAPDQPHEEFPALPYDGEEFEPAGYIGYGNDGQASGYIEADRSHRDRGGYEESDGYTDDYADDGYADDYTDYADGYADESYDEASGYHDDRSARHIA